MALLQGIGDEDWYRFQMDELPPRLAQSFLENARLEFELATMFCFLLFALSTLRGCE